MSRHLVLQVEFPLGPFLRFSSKPLTPGSWFALDGTPYVENEVPYLIFSHEWVQVGNGMVDAVRLEADLSSVDGEPSAPGLNPPGSSFFSV